MRKNHKKVCNFKQNKLTICLETKFLHQKIRVTNVAK